MAPRMGLRYVDHSYLSGNAAENRRARRGFSTYLTGKAGRSKRSARHGAPCNRTWVHLAEPWVTFSAMYTADAAMVDGKYLSILCSRSIRSATHEAIHTM
mgnify:CR=1 FL=1